MPKISVIVPVYNQEKYLEACLTSICSQTLQDIEIICINDCSTDGSFEILKTYQKFDNRISIIDLDKNHGVGYARNLGIKEAKGEFIAFVDGDDFIDLDFYEVLYNNAIKQNLDVAKGVIEVYDEKTNMHEAQSWIDLNHLVRKHKAYFYFTFTTAIFKTSIIKNNNIKFIENFIHAEDPYFTIKAALFYEKIGTFDNVRYFYTDNKESASRKKFTIKHAQNQVEASKMILKLLEKNNVEKKHYLIVLNFVIGQLLEWCNLYNISDEMTDIVTDGLHYVLNNCKYNADWLKYHFKLKKEEQKYQAIKKIRQKIKVKVNA